jgi:hypothetical protein
MLAGRLAHLVDDVRQEFARFQLIALLQQGVNLSGQRAHMADPNYAVEARNIRDRAQQILDQSIIDQYPTEIREFIINSRYFSVLPKELARILMLGFPDNKTSAISSNELQIYLNAAANMMKDLDNLHAAFDRFGVTYIEIPETRVGLDLIIPRNVFGNEAFAYLESLAPFLNIAEYFTELTTGSKEPPTLVYTSTTDPVTGIALVATAAWGFLKFYKLLLDVADKQISLNKTIRTMRESGLDKSDTTNVEAKIAEIGESNLQKAVQMGVDGVSAHVPAERIMEIKIGIAKDAARAVDSIAKGARIAITFESRDRLSLIVEQVEEVTLDQMQQEIVAQQELEHKISAEITPLATSLKRLMTVKGGNTTTDGGEAV